MALLLTRSPCMLRGVVHSVKSISVNKQRLIHLAPPRAKAADDAGEEGASKRSVVGKVVLARRLAEAHKDHITIKLAGELIDSLLDDIMLTVAEGETVTIPGFGTFKKRTRPARKGRNPSTGAEMNIPEKDAPAFSAGSAFKGVVLTGSWEAYDEMVARQKAEKTAKGKK